MTEPVRRRRGRPRLQPGTPTSQVTVQLPQTLHDRACVRALELGVALNQYVRQVLERALEAAAAANKQPEKTSVVRPGRY